MYYLLQGSYFQNKEWLDIACVPLEGNVAVVRRGLIHAMYAGAVWPDPERALGALTGCMLDANGTARLFDVHISPREVHFKKQYERRDYILTYAFNTQQNGVWLGTYSGTIVGRGISSCIVTAVEGEELLNAERILGKLGMTHAHEWAREMEK